METKIAIAYKQELEQEPLFRELSALISSYPDLFVAVVAHGSFGSRELLPFSDFDGLLLVKDEFLHSEKLRDFQKQSMKCIYRFDPLQHHSWFVLAENQFNDYPELYFPHVLFADSALIYPKENLELQFNLPEVVDYTLSYQRLAASLRKKIASSFTAKNRYQLKSYLSEIMLLPAVFLAAKLHKGVPKKESFKLIETHLSAELLSPLALASACRLNWKKTEIKGIQGFVMTRPERFFRKLTQKLVAPALSSEEKSKFDLNFNQKLVLLINEMDKQLHEGATDTLI